MSAKLDVIVPREYHALTPILCGPVVGAKSPLRKNTWPKQVAITSKMCTTDHVSIIAGKIGIIQ